MGGFNNYELLISKLDQFIRKYYLNQLLRGLIYASALVLALFLIVNALEYFFYLPTLGRKILFYGFLSVTGFVAIRWIIIPLVKYYKLGKVISHEQAAKIIGIHFSNVEDRLLNILQLKKQSESLTDLGLINASIDQKIDQLKPVPFTAAIDLNNNRKYLRYLVVPVLAFVVVLFAAPSLITDGANRLLHNDTVFEKPAPFQFKVMNQDLKAVQYSSLDLEVQITGNVLPDQVYVKEGDNSYKMQKQSASTYTYTFSNLQKDADFVLSAVGYDSREYTIQVLPKPMIIGFNVALDYPEYTGKKDEVIANGGDLSVPAGTKVIWNFNTKDTRVLSVHLGDTVVNAASGTKDHFVLMKTMRQSTAYTLKVSGEELKDADSITYSIAVAPDQYPTIDVKPIEDTVAQQYMYFLGEISDDYGLRNLQMAYKVIGKDGKDSEYKTAVIPFNRGSKISQFSYYWEPSALKLEAGDQVNYFFEVWDNDGVNGSKSTRSSMMTFRMPSDEEMEAIVEQSNEQVKDQLSNTMDKAEELKKKAEQMREKMLDKKNLSWEDKKALEDMVNKQKELKQNLESLQKEFNQNLDKKENQQMSEALKEKQDKLKELFDQVMNEEMKALFDKLDSLMAQMEDKKDVLDQLEQFKMTDEQLQKELDRMLALFKQLEFEQKLEKTVDKLEKMAEEQEKLADETEKKSKDADALAKEQDELNKKMDDVAKDMEELKDINKDMDKEMSFEKPESEQKQAEQKMSDSKQSLQQQKNKKASESQKGAAQDMKEMAHSLNEMQSQAQQEQAEEDLKAIRQLLENLVDLSFNQEKVMDKLAKTNINNPDYLKLMQDQRNIKDDAQMVEYSLYALAKRIVEIQSFVTKEMNDINKNIGKGLKSLEDRNKGGAGVNQQLVMTGFNNLALMLSEAMDQMQQQMQNQMQGMGACNKPKPGQKSGMSMSQMQKELNEQIKKMMEGQKPGDKPGQKPGDKPGEGQSMSKELAQSAAKQKALREALKQLAEQEGKDGKGGGLGDLQKLMDEMNKTETDLVNKHLNTEMLKRQQEILTRLLETEDALKERETDKERKSETAKEVARTLPPSLEEYLKKREAEIQLYKTVPPALKPYYKNLVENYFKNISF